MAEIHRPLRSSPGSFRFCLLALVGFPVLIAGHPTSPFVNGPSEGAWTGTDAAPGFHTELRESRPAADTVVDDVREVLLEFTTPVLLELSRITVLGPEGAEVPASEVQHPDSESTHQLVVRFHSPLPPGGYRVRWSTTAPDGHPLSDTLAFRVSGEAAQAPPPEAAPPTADRVPPPDRETATPLGTVPAGTGQRWLHLLGTILLLGVATFRFAVLRVVMRKGGMDAVNERAERGLRRFGWTAGAILVVTLVTRLGHQLGELGGGDGRAWDFMPYLLFRTAWGAGWGLHLAAILLVGIGLTLATRAGAGSRGWSIVAGAAVILPLVPALQGHAMGSESRVMTLPIMYLHVAAVGAWLGGLLMLILVGLPSVRKLPASAGDKPPLARVVNAFSRVGLVAVATLVTAGVANAFLYGIGFGDLLGTAWGRTLILKLVVVAAALLLGFYNWRRVQPTLVANPDPGALRIPATVEAVLGLVVLLVTAALVATPLP